ncbi:hypothetical protein E2C01_088286 [Portunus trituberculatus]|uniref:Uncharacterized protein n=1 Tax=Portunus trituberculatus TaxID=210409 RepID=A0A5B7JLI8_PORTR|nr:hypothetical protein [Portunus trituberculatus]
MPGHSRTMGPIGSHDADISQDAAVPRISRQQKTTGRWDTTVS